MSPVSYSAAACGEESPEYAVSGPPGVVSTCFWFGRGQRVTRDTPGVWVGLEKVRGGAGFRGGGSAWRNAPASGCSRGSRGYDPSTLAPKRQRGDGGRLQRLESSEDVVQEARRRRSAARCGRRSGTGRCGGRSRGSRLGGVSGLRAELPRRLVVVGASGSAGNRGGGAPAPTPGGAAARLRAAARVGGGCSGWEVGCGRGSGRV